MLLPGLILAGIFLHNNQSFFFSKWGEGTFIDEIAVTILVVSLIFIGFSSFNNENEQITKTRLNALYWSLLIDCSFYIFYLIFLLFKLYQNLSFLYLDIFNFIAGYNLILLLCLSNARFYFLVFLLKRGRKIRTLYFLPSRVYLSIAKISILLFIVIGILSIISKPFYNLLTHIPDTCLVLFPISLLIWLWTKEKNEIGVIKNMRLKAMQIAVYVFYSLFIVLTWLVYEGGYLLVLLVGFLGLVIIFFIVFYTQLYLASRKMKQKLATN